METGTQLALVAWPAASQAVKAAAGRAVLELAPSNPGGMASESTRRSFSAHTKADVGVGRDDPAPQQMSPLDDYSMRVTGILYGPCREIREMDPAKSRGSAPPLIVRTRNRRERSALALGRCEMAHTRTHLISHHAIHSTSVRTARSKLRNDSNRVAPRITAPLRCTREKSQLLNVRA